MGVRPNQLRTPEQGVDLATRERAEPEDPATELAAMRARINATRTLEDTSDRRHCQDCFTRGVKAAIAAIEGTTEDDKTR